MAGTVRNPLKSPSRWPQCRGRPRHRSRTAPPQRSGLLFVYLFVCLFLRLFVCRRPLVSSAELSAATFDRLLNWVSLGKPSVLLYNTGGATQALAALHMWTVRDRRHICAGTGLTPATSAPGLGSPLPHLHRDWAHPCHISTGTRPIPATSALGLGPSLPHLHRD
jgi:hypothetical protein